MEGRQLGYHTFILFTECDKVQVRVASIRYHPPYLPYLPTYCLPVHSLEHTLDIVFLIPYSYHTPIISYKLNSYNHRLQAASPFSNLNNPFDLI